MADENPSPAPPVTSPGTPTPAESPALAPPPAAEIVSKSPRELILEAEVESEKRARLEAERKAADAEDALTQLKDLDQRRPAPPRQRNKPKKGGWTFFNQGGN